MKNLLKRAFSPGVAFVHDLMMVPLAWLAAYWFRFNLYQIPEPMLQYALWDLLLVVPVQVAVFRLFGLYRGVWRFASLPDLARIVKAVAVGLALSIVMAGGLIATVRKTRGDDIDAACGQLVGKVRDRTRRSAMHRSQMTEMQR